MADSYVSSLYHCVWGTKNRLPTIRPQLQERLWPYIGGLAKQNGFTAMEVGGVEDHMHSLLALPSTLPISKAVQLVKGSSSKWLHDTFPEHRDFEWQEGYGAFSIGVSQVDNTVAYIQNQREHHRQRSFQEELIAILQKHHMEYDLRYLWG